MALELSEALLAAAHPDDPIAVALEVGPHKAPDVELVLDDQDRRHDMPPRVPGTWLVAARTSPHVWVVGSHGINPDALVTCRHRDHVALLGGLEQTMTAARQARIGGVSGACKV